MRIRVGCEMTYQFGQDTPMIVMLNVHASRVSDLERPDYVITTPSVPLEGYRDTFGNWCNRRVCSVGGDEPVADVMGGVGAETVGPAWFGQRAPGIALRLQGRERVRLRQLAKFMRTALADRVLEREQLPAMLALKQLHWSNPRGRPGEGRGGFP